MKPSLNKLVRDAAVVTADVGSLLNDQTHSAHVDGPGFSVQYNVMHPAASSDKLRRHEMLEGLGALNYADNREAFGLQVTQCANAILGAGVGRDPASQIFLVAECQAEAVKLAKQQTHDARTVPVKKLSALLRDAFCGASASDRRAALSKLAVACAKNRVLTGYFLYNVALELERQLGCGEFAESLAIEQHVVDGVGAFDALFTATATPASDVANALVQQLKALAEYDQHRPVDLEVDYVSRRAAETAHNEQAKRFRSFVGEQQQQPAAAAAAAGAAAGAGAAGVARAAVATDMAVDAAARKPGARVVFRVVFSEFDSTLQKLSDRAIILSADVDLAVAAMALPSLKNVLLVRGKSGAEYTTLSLQDMIDVVLPKLQPILDALEAQQQPLLSDDQQRRFIAAVFRSGHTDTTMQMLTKAAFARTLATIERQLLSGEIEPAQFDALYGLLNAGGDVQANEALQQVMAPFLGVDVNVAAAAQFELHCAAWALGLLPFYGVDRKHAEEAVTAALHSIAGTPLLLTQITRLSDAAQRTALRAAHAAGVRHGVAIEVDAALLAKPQTEAAVAADAGEAPGASSSSTAAAAASRLERVHVKHIVVSPTFFIVEPTLSDDGKKRRSMEERAQLNAARAKAHADRLAQHKAAAERELARKAERRAAESERDRAAHEEQEKEAREVAKRAKRDAKQAAKKAKHDAEARQRVADRDRAAADVLESMRVTSTRVDGSNVVLSVAHALEPANVRNTYGLIAVRLIETRTGAPAVVRQVPSTPTAPKYAVDPDGVVQREMAATGVGAGTYAVLASFTSTSALVREVGRVVVAPSSDTFDLRVSGRLLSHLFDSPDDLRDAVAATEGVPRVRRADAIGDVVVELQSSTAVTVFFEKNRRRDDVTVQLLAAGAPVSTDVGCFLSNVRVQLVQLGDGGERVVAHVALGGAGVGAPDVAVAPAGAPPPPPTVRHSSRTSKPSVEAIRAQRNAQRLAEAVGDDADDVDDDDTDDDDVDDDTAVPDDTTSDVRVGVRGEKWHSFVQQCIDATPAASATFALRAVADVVVGGAPTVLSRTGFTFKQLRHTVVSADAHGVDVPVAAAGKRKRGHGGDDALRVVIECTIGDTHYTLAPAEFQKTQRARSAARAAHAGCASSTFEAPFSLPDGALGEQIRAAVAEAVALQDALFTSLHGAVRVGGGAMQPTVEAMQQAADAVAAVLDKFNSDELELLLGKQSAAYLRAQLVEPLLIGVPWRNLPRALAFVCDHVGSEYELSKKAMAILKRVVLDRFIGTKKKTAPDDDDAGDEDDGAAAAVLGTDGDDDDDDDIGAAADDGDIANAIARLSAKQQTQLAVAKGAVKTLLVPFVASACNVSVVDFNKEAMKRIGKPSMAMAVGGDGGTKKAKAATWSVTPARLIALVHSLVLLAASRRKGATLATLSIKYTSVAFPRAGGIGRLPMITIDKSMLSARGTHETGSPFVVFSHFFGEAAMRSFVLDHARNSEAHRRVLGSTFRTDGYAVLFEFVDHSKHSRVAPGADNELTRQLERALAVDPRAEQQRTCDLFLPGPCQSAKPHLVRAALRQGSFGDMTAADVFAALPKSKPAPPKKGDADHWDLGAKLADKLRADPVDVFTPADATTEATCGGAVDFDVRAFELYERAFRCGIARGALTWRSLISLLTRILIGIDCGQKDLAFLVAGCFASVVRGESVLDAAKRILAELGVHDLQLNTVLSPDNVASLLDELDFVVATHRVRGASLHNDAIQQGRASVAGRAAAQARGDEAGSTGWRAADGTRWRIFSDSCHKHDSFTPLMADAVQRSRDGIPAQQRRHRRHALDSAAESPLVVARKLLDALGVAGVSNRALRQRICIFIGKPTFGAVRGHRASPAKSLVRALARRFQVIVLDEYNTSQKCPSCGGQFKRARADSIRFYHCECCGADQSIQNKDFAAAFSMIQIGLSLVLFGKRPAPWARPEPRPTAPTSSAATAATSSKTAPH